MIQPTIKEEDRNYEIIDTQEKKIYRVPEWMIPSIIERIEYEEMTKDWVKATKFNSDQGDNLRVLLNMLFFSGGNEELYEKITEQTTADKVPVAYSYEELFNEAKERITKEGYDRTLRKMKPLYKFWNQELPNIFSEFPHFSN